MLHKNKYFFIDFWAFNRKQELLQEKDANKDPLRTKTWKRASEFLNVEDFFEGGTVFLVWVPSAADPETRMLLQLVY